MGENIKGYEFNDIISKLAGSPAVNYVFSKRVESVMIDNTGSPGVYAKFDGTATTGSTSLFIPHKQFRIFDVRVGSISLYVPNAGSPLVNVVGLRDQ